MEMDRDFWNDSFKEGPEGVHVLDFVIGDEIAHLEPGRALDLGCGAGSNALMLAGQGWRVTGVDWSEEAVRVASEAAAAQGLEARFIVGDVTTWEPPETYDLVISTYALPAGADARTAVRTARSALADGGTLLVVEWDVSMREVWEFFEEGDFLPLAEMTEILSDLTIEKAEVRRISEMFSDPDDMRYDFGREANIAIFRARRMD
ncbi:class I SAM-dependent methyltransferase [Gemmatimonadota bacterium]